MLRSFRRRLRVTLEADRVLVHTVKGWPRRVVTDQILLVSKHGAAPAWEAALAVWRTWMANAVSVGAKVDVVLADSFVRYALIPWPGQMLRRRELDTLVRIEFGNVYGDAVNAWTCRHDLRAYGSPGIACALEDAFLRAIAAVCEDARCTLSSVEPQFMHFLNGAKLPLEGAAVVALMGSNACTLAVRDESGWRSIRTVRCQPARLRQVLERERLLQGLMDDAPVFVAGLPGTACGELETMAGCIVLPEAVRTATDRASVRETACV